MLLVLGGLVWLLLAGLPFGGREREAEAPRVETETIAEGAPVAPSSPRETGTILDVEGERPAEPEPEPQPVRVPASEPEPVRVPASEPKPVRVPASEPRPVRVPASEPRPVRVPASEPKRVPMPVPPPPAPDPQPRMLSDEQASATLRGYVTSRDYYDGVEDDCVRVESRGFRNRGFTYEVWNSCERGGGSRLLGRWRVDALTREVFRQRDDGRYLRP